MSTPLVSQLRHLDHCLTDRGSIAQLKGILDKIDKCCQALERNHNLADILQDPTNAESLQKLFGEEGHEIGVQLVLKIALRDYEIRSFSITAPVDGDRKIDFLFKTLGGWKQFDAVFTFQNQNKPGSPITIVNPRQREHWDELETIPEGTLVTIYVRTAALKRSRPQEKLAAERYQAVFDVVQSRADLQDTSFPAPVVQMNPHVRENGSANGQANGNGSTEAKAAPAPARKVARPTTPRVSSFARRPSVSTSGPPAFSFQLVINKMDTFVHAGNAQMIVNHVQDYQGRVMMYVIRAERKPVQLDADSIWGAEIRNGETVLYEFFGPKPTDEFVKELAKKTNKYTQMDKMAE
jgi:hypothetical protein